MKNDIAKSNEILDLLLFFRVVYLILGRVGTLSKNIYRLSATIILRVGEVDAYHLVFIFLFYFIGFFVKLLETYSNPKKQLSFIYSSMDTTLIWIFG